MIAYTHTQPQTTVSAQQPPSRTVFPLCPTALHPSSVVLAALPADTAQPRLLAPTARLTATSFPSTAAINPFIPAFYPATMPAKQRSRPLSNATPATAGRQRASDKQRNRLARKAELARLSRRRKKVHMAGVMDELEALRRQVAELKDANAKGLKWVESSAGSVKAGSGAATGSGGRQRMEEEEGSDAGSEFDSDSEADEVLEDSPPRGGHRRSSVTSSSSSSSTSPSFRSRDRHSHDKKRSKRRSKHRYISDSDSDTDSDTSDDSEYERRRKHKRAKKSASPASITFASTATSSPSSISTSTSTTTPPPSPIVTLQTISLEALDLVGSQPILSRLFLSLPLLSTSFLALRSHLLSQSFHYATEAYAFVVQRRVLSAAEEAAVLASAGLAAGASVQLVHRALLGGMEAASGLVGGGTLAGPSATAVLGVKSEEEEAARAISTLAVAAAVV